LIVGAAGFLFGIPSALNLQFFANQDFVWGVGLMLSGFFFAFAVTRFGVTKFRETYINHEHSDIRVGAWWDWAIRFVMVEAVVLIAWWFWQARSESFADTWSLFRPFNVGTVVIQSVLALGVFLLANRWLVRRTLRDGDTAMGEDP
jgi:NSS family neurotransmitter:Na+ symporter